MKFQVQMKDPGTLLDAIDEAVKADLAKAIIYVLDPAESLCYAGRIIEVRS